MARHSEAEHSDYRQGAGARPECKSLFSSVALGEFLRSPVEGQGRSLPHRVGVGIK